MGGISFRLFSASSCFSSFSGCFGADFASLSFSFIFFRVVFLLDDSFLWLRLRPSSSSSSEMMLAGGMSFFASRASLTIFLASVMIASTFTSVALGFSGGGTGIFMGGLQSSESRLITAYLLTLTHSQVPLSFTVTSEPCWLSLSMLQIHTSTQGSLILSSQMGQPQYLEAEWEAIKV